MNTYIVLFSASHKVILVEQKAIFIWQQESGEIDTEMLKGKIMRESAIHFFGMVAGENYKVLSEDISIKILKTESFRG